MFGHFNIGVFTADIILGIVLLAIGFGMKKNADNKGKGTVGWIFIFIGCIGMISGAMQLLKLFLK